MVEMLDPGRNPPKNYQCSMTFVTVHNSIISWNMKKMGENEKKKGEIFLKDEVPRKRRQVMDSDKNLGNLVFLDGLSCL